MEQEQQELYLLIIRHLNNQTTAEEQTFIATWLDKSDENKQLYKELETIWAATQVAEEETATAKALAVVHQRIRTTRSRYYRYAAAAAALLILIIAGGFLFVKHQPVYVAQHSGPGQILQFTLPDGTKVHLAPQSTLRYPQDMNTRRMMLEGEAFFEVSKDPHRPFTVQAGKMAVKVLGTRFNISHYQEDAAVSLVDGKVQVLVNDETFALQPGQQLSYNSKENKCKQQDYDVESVTGWTNRLLVFRNETLVEAAAKIEQLYDVKIIFDDPAIEHYRLFARFENKSLPYILDVIKATDNLNYTIKDKNVYITQTK